MSAHKTIAVLAGDGIGPEVMHEALRVLDVVCSKFKRKIELRHASIGGAAFEQYGTHFPEVTRDLCRASDAILFGSVGGPVAETHLPKWRDCETNSILALRKEFNLFANFRPAKVYPSLIQICPLRADIIQDGVDLLVLRELQGDVYFGEHLFFERNNERCSRDSGEYAETQIRAAATVAFEAAQKRRWKVTSVDKANVLHMSKLWREVVHEVHKGYPDVKLEDMLVDNCALQLVLNPRQFDVILTGNLFGDILSDIAAALPGSLGLTPSASLNGSSFGLYEPSGGSAPDIADMGIANPIAQILSVAMLLRFSFGWEAEADAIEAAVENTLQAGLRTRDIASLTDKVVPTSEMGSSIATRISYATN